MTEGVLFLLPGTTTADVAAAVLAAAIPATPAAGTVAARLRDVDVPVSSRSSSVAVEALGTPAQAAAVADVRDRLIALTTAVGSPAQAAALATLAATVGTPAQAAALVSLAAAVGTPAQAAALVAVRDDLAALVQTRATPADVQARPPLYSGETR